MNESNIEAREFIMRFLGEISGAGMFVRGCCLKMPSLWVGTLAVDKEVRVL